MIAHVAEAGEDRGRVVLRLGPTASHSPIAVAAAMRVAAAYGSELESLFVEDAQLFDAVRFPFVRELDVATGSVRELAPETLSRRLRATAGLVQGEVAEHASACGVRVRASVVRADPLVALAEACSESGPWNVIVLGDAIAADDMALLSAMFDSVVDATGVVLVGTAATSDCGPVVAVVEDLARLPPMLRAAQRLAATTGGRIDLVFLAADVEFATWMEGQARLAIGNSPTVSVAAVEVADSSTRAVAGIAALRAGFVIAQFGGLLVHPDDTSGAIAQLACPVFLVR